MRRQIHHAKHAITTACCIMRFKHVDGHLLVELHLVRLTDRFGDPRLLGVLGLITTGAPKVLRSSDNMLVTSQCPQHADWSLSWNSVPPLHADVEAQLAGLCWWQAPRTCQLAALHSPPPNPTHPSQCDVSSPAFPPHLLVHELHQVDPSPTDLLVLPPLQMRPSSPSSPDSSSLPPHPWRCWSKVSPATVELSCCDCCPPTADANAFRRNTVAIDLSSFVKTASDLWLSDAASQTACPQGRAYITLVNARQLKGLVGDRVVDGLIDDDGHGFSTKSSRPLARREYDPCHPLQNWIPLLALLEAAR